MLQCRFGIKSTCIKPVTFAQPVKPSIAGSHMPYLLPEDDGQQSMRFQGCRRPYFGELGLYQWSRI